MKTSIAYVPTKNASRYIQQLCKHFGHRVSADYTSTNGWVEFPFGRCDLSADAEQITLKSTAKPDDLPKLEEIVANHLSRFAFRENPKITWQPAGEPNQQTGELT